MKGEHSLEITTSLLVSYAYGMLAPAIAMQVKQALEQDEVLRLQYQGIIQLIQDYPDEDPEELLEQMGMNVAEKVATSLQQQPPAAKPFYRRWLLFAAIIIILAGVGTFIAVQSSQHSPEQLAIAMIKEGSANPYSNRTRDGISPTDTAVTWKDAFVNTNFDSVILLLKNKNSLSSEEQFFLALAYLKVTPSQPDKAEPLLQQLTTVNNEYTPDAWLYLGLAQTLQNKHVAALQSLSHVAQTTQVKDLTERLRR